MSKPRLAIVSSHKICCALAYYAEALKEILCPAFDVEIIDLKTSELLRQEGKDYAKLSEAHIDQLCLRLQNFDIVNVHLEIGIFGTSIDQITSRILKICQASGRLIFTVHTIDYKQRGGNAYAYRQIIRDLKQRPSSNPYHIITHLPHESTQIKNHFEINNVTDFPLIYLTNERRKHFLRKRNPILWKQQFGLKEGDITIGVFGLISSHKNYLHALRTLNLLPENYKLLIIGEAHHMSVKELQIDPAVQEMLAYLDTHPALAHRVVFTGKREDEKYYEDLANVDFVLLSSFEVWQSGSATFSNALELCCPTLKSNTYNCGQYEIYFPNCFESFDIGNYYETKNKILNFDRTKIENLRKKVDLFSETQLRQIYMSIYESMKACQPITLSSTRPSKRNPFTDLPSKVIHKPFVRTLFNKMPGSIQFMLRKLKNKLSV